MNTEQTAHQGDTAENAFHTTMTTRFPQKVIVAELRNSRYQDGRRPFSWDLRTEGIDTVVLQNGEELKLFSSGQQSPPRSGWIIMIYSGDSARGYKWTLYGFAPGADVDGISLP